VRLIAATNRDLETAVAEGRFRSDLFFRLSVVPIVMPPLREREGDVPLLAHLFLDRYARELGKQIDSISPATMERLIAYDWPGNVRELSNMMERAVVLARGPVIDFGSDLLPTATARSGKASPRPPARVAPADPNDRAGSRTLEDVERQHVLDTLDRTSWRIEGPDGAASVLGLNPSTLRSRIKKLGLQRPGPARSRCAAPGAPDGGEPSPRSA
jgi:transcriptional regulator with GAF, ATPase, and Fis domain